MKILIVNISDISGGAARAAYRLHKALLTQGIDSKMLVQIKESDDWRVETTVTNKIQKGINLIRSTIDGLPTKFYKNKVETPFSPSWIGFGGVINKINEVNPDVVHLHWVAEGMMCIEDFAKIKAPIVWSLHDNWAFTGGCHIMWECDKYKNNCGTCPRLGSNKENDLSRKVFNRKQKTFDKIKDITIVGLSHWLNECSKSSTLLKGKKHINLPNPIDTSIFKPFDKKQSKALWRLPKNKKLILFGAMSATSDTNKGFKELNESLSKLQNKDIELVVFGSSKPKESQSFGFKTHYLGRLHDDVSLTTLYNLADVMVVPSKQENLSNAIMESLSCGTPVVGFDIGGNSDMVEHKKNGYLAKPFDTSDLKDGVEWILNHDNYEELCRNARAKVLEEFESQIVAKKYIKLYKDILEQYI